MLLGRFAADDLLRREGDAYRTTRRWQAAMARAAVQLYERGGEERAKEDLRVPIALALVEIYGADTPDETLATWIETLLPIEEAEVMPRAAAR
jgi:hypothetical protein